MWAVDCYTKRYVTLREMQEDLVIHSKHLYQDDSQRLLIWNLVGSPILVLTKLFWILCTRVDSTSLDTSINFDTFKRWICLLTSDWITSLDADLDLDNGIFGVGAERKYKVTMLNWRTLNKINNVLSWHKQLCYINLDITADFRNSSLTWKLGQPEVEIEH